MRHTKRIRRTRKRKSRKGGGWFGLSESDYAKIIANLNNNSKIEDILKTLYYDLQLTTIDKLKQKAQGRNIDYVTQRINAIVTEREADEIE